MGEAGSRGLCIAVLVRCGICDAATMHVQAMWVPSAAVVTSWTLRRRRGGGGVPFRGAAEDTLGVVGRSPVDGAATGYMAANQPKLPTWPSLEEMICTVANTR